MAKSFLDWFFTSLNLALIYLFIVLCLSRWSGDMFKITDIFDLNSLLYSSWYDEASITKTVLFVIFFSKSTGLPILPTSLTSVF